VRRLVALLLVLGSCSLRARTPCEEACTREARCADELEIPGGDSVECANRCAALERDPRAQELVASHLECVQDAPTCQAVVDCP
jgi:hypothetical protein